MSTKPFHEPNGIVPDLSLGSGAAKRIGDIAALLEEEMKYRLLVEHIPAITYIAAMDKDSSTLYTSPQIEQLLGFSQAEWMADHTLWLKQIHPDDRAFVLQELVRIHAGGDPKPCEYRMFTRTGQVVWFRDDAAVLRDNEGRPLALYGVMLDISERKRVEAELAEAQRQLWDSRKPRLEQRELAALRLIKAGRKDWEIGQELMISERTVRYCLKGIRDKLGVASRAAAVAEAIRLGLLHE